MGVHETNYSTVMLNVRPSVGVLLAAFEGMRWIQEQIDSILNQRDVDVVIYISVDLSGDGTFEYVKGLSESCLNIVVLPYGQRFGGAAKNFLRLIRDIDFTLHDYIALADQDDIWFDDKLIRAHRKMIENSASAYSSNVIAFWDDGREQLIEKSQPQSKWDYLFEAAGPGCTYVLRKDLALAIQSLVRQRWRDAEQLGLHDWFFYAFARANGFVWIIDEHPGMRYRQHGNNQVGVNLGLKAYVYRARKVLGGWGLTQSALIANLVGLGRHPFVLKWASGSRMGALWLAFHAWECRRRLRDKVLFSLSCLSLCLFGKSPS